MKDYNISPTDTYVVVNKSILNEEDRNILTMLYQPIIGPLPIMLYLSFWSDLDNKDMVSCEYTHHHLFASMQLSPHQILDARKKLEAIGLLKTYLKEDGINSYIYQLYSPISSFDFFNHPILNVVLYNNLGKRDYDRLKEFFKMPKVVTSSYKDISSSFQEVFRTLPSSSLEFDNDDIRKKSTRKLNVDVNFDFNFLMDSLPNNLDNSKIFTDEVKELILQLSFLYDLDVIKMQDIIPICLNERGTINKEELRKTCRNYYQFDNQGQLPSVVYNSQPEFLMGEVQDSSPRAKMIHTFETISPYELLKSKNKGAEPTNRDLKLAEDLIITYKLKPGVVNVIIDYILKTNNNKLTRALAETIAGQWKRLNIETVDDAMRLAEKEHKKYRKSPNSGSKSRVVREEKLPEWFDKNIKRQQASEAEQKEMEDLLREYQ